jgi:hypothetical protein
MHFLFNQFITSKFVVVAALYLFANMLNEEEAMVVERTRVKALLDTYLYNT